MTISSRTPEGPLHHCPVCRERSAIEISPQGDSCCPHCGHLLWWFRNKLKNDSLQLNATWVEDLGHDSLDTVELVMELEEEFDISIPDDAAEKIQTVADAIRFIRERGRFKRS